MTPEHEALLDKAFNALGSVSHKAAFADAMLYEVFHHISNCDRRVSRAVYFTLDALQTKRTLTNRVGEAMGIDADALKAIEKLGDSIKKVADQRNGLAHSLFVLRHDDTWEMRVHRINPKHQQNATVEVKEPALVQAELQAQESLEKAQAVFEDVCQRLGIQPLLLL